MDLLVDAFAILACIAGGGTGKRRIGNSQAARELVDENFRDATLTVSKLARRLNCHRISLNRSFREAYGVNLSEYIMSLRQQEALRLIRDSDLPFKEVALCSGFSSPGYFIQRIRKTTGMTPGELREKSRRALR
jgi:AraC-like DNA-binding protein